MADLILETKGQPDRTRTVETATATMLLTPPIDEDYWLYRVRLSDKQAIIGFPKFSTIGIGFAVEEDWNTNLPFTSEAEAIYKHIKHNKGDPTISTNDCIAAIRMVQEAATQYKLREAAARGGEK